MPRPSRWSVIFAFALVYVFWGSTYLGIDIAIQSIPPALMCAIRFSIAGVVLLAYCWFRGQNVRYSPQQLAYFAVVGILLLMGGNLTLAYAEEYVPSGLAALLVAVTPLWLLVLDALLLGTHRISQRGLAGLGLGIAGSAVLIWPSLTQTGSLGRRELWFSLALLGGSFSWALGSVLSKRWQSGPPSFSATAWQMIFAGAGNFVLATFSRDFSRVVWTPKGIGAVAYLIVCGSWIGYTAYIWLLGHVPTAKVSTYAYVNPVVAVFLGWLVLHERIDRYIVMGSAIIVTAVVLVTSAKMKMKTRTETSEIVTAEASS
ncbi:MAG: EamA family transporter [Acidobacteriaceae bacterium]|jgi:drug/metabolite transporter (DMT)-like permease|nr:EamA family transporter [Acidobacteriaceae bacterium]